MADTIKRIKCSYATEEDMNTLFRNLRHNKQLVEKYLGLKLLRGERVTLEHALRIMLLLARREGLLTVQKREEPERMIYT